MAGTTQTENWSEAFTYDRYGNRIQKFRDGVEIQNNALSHPTIDQNTNRFTSNGYGYDKVGNLIEDADDRSFTFDGNNKQILVTNVNSQAVGEYFYDGDGKRVKKKRYVGGGLAETVIFVYSGGKLVEEYSTDVPQSPKTKYLTEDHLGTPRVITDGNGDVISRRDFMPFGEDLGSTVGTRSTSSFKYSSNDDDVRQKFTGYQKDEETGLDFAEARMYENRHARFTAVDPLLASGNSANPQTFNRYVYVMNNPLFYTDPTGENCDPCDDEHMGLVYTMTDKEGNTFYNDEKLNDNWNIFEGNVTTTNKSTGTTVEVWGAYHDGVYHGGWGVSDENPIGVDAEIKPTGIDMFLGGFSEATYNVPTDIGRGIGNAGINTYNLGNFLTTNHYNREPLFNYIEPYEYTRENSTFGKGFEYGVPLIPAVVAPVMFGGSATAPSFTAPNLQRSAIVTEKGLNRVTSHLTQFGDDAGNTGMVNRLNDAMRSGNRVTGADRNFYFHELKESTLMRRGISYESAHQKAIVWDRVSPFELYHRQVVQANPTIFSPNYMRFWTKKK